MFSKLFIILFFTLLFLLLQENLRPLYRISYVRELSEGDEENSVQNNQQGNENYTILEKFEIWDYFELKVNRKWNDIQKEQKLQDDNIVEKSWLMLNTLPHTEEDLVQSVSKWFDKVNSLLIENREEIIADNHNFDRWKQNLENRLFRLNVSNWKDVAKQEWKEMKEKMEKNKSDRKNRMIEQLEDWFHLEFPSLIINFEW